MGYGRYIRWCGEAQSGQEAEGTLDQVDDQHGSVSRAYRRRPSSAHSSPLDGDKLRRRESYPSSHLLASTTSLHSSTASPSSSTSSHFTQGNDSLHETGFLSSPRDHVPPVLAATSRDFAELFPSSSKLLIRHDDTTFDGNMNLRVDAPVVTAGSSRRDMTLYHLRMYDLRCRDMSLRRYCRESGREVCHCVRKSHKSMLGARPNIRRSLSSAFAAMIPKHDSKQHQTLQQRSHLKRHDSGYDTMHSDQEQEEDDGERPQSSHSNKAPAKDASDLISFEFSNYAHLDLKRRGFKTDKRYDFDYWGIHYSWHRSTQKLGTLREVSYHLTRRDGSLVARIVPEPCSEDEALAETDKGGWIQPYSIRIVDKKIIDDKLADIADIIVSTGLIVLVDDSIRRHFRRRDQHRHALHLPVIKGHWHRDTRATQEKRTDLPAQGPKFVHRQLLANSL